MYLEWFFKEKAAGEKSLEEVVVDLLAERKLHVTTAESCTGGLIAGTLVNVAGASDVLNEGYVTYSNEAKERLIHVSHETLETYGAVSEQTAHEMAEGAAKAANADAVLSATGIAGPGGGKAGLSCIYWMLSEWEDDSERVSLEWKSDGEQIGYCESSVGDAEGTSDGRDAGVIRKD